ncbi:hypothetical protein AVEN_182611-1 [Araneus ventricosus]|uniref:Uncharacterized protein n=1 Tax=Araneus ventricosus TaxID=182803 RepID=A0A4Y2INB6_ARAVE|nr:hypothetical protein AVEN_182611-1 [Araneus ventricosus]
MCSVSRSTTLISSHLPTHIGLRTVRTLPDARFTHARFGNPPTEGRRWEKRNSCALAPRSCRGLRHGTPALCGGQPSLLRTLKKQDFLPWNTGLVSLSFFRSRGQD